MHKRLLCCRERDSRERRAQNKARNGPSVFSGEKVRDPLKTRPVDWSVAYGVAVHCGRVVNSEGAKNQVEGAIVFGLSAALYGEIAIKNGVVTKANFNQCVLRRK